MDGGSIPPSSTISRRICPRQGICASYVSGQRLRSAIGLQPAVLDAIGDGLGEHAELLAAPRSDDFDGRIRVAVGREIDSAARELSGPHT